MKFHWAKLDLIELVVTETSYLDITAEKHETSLTRRLVFRHGDSATEGLLHKRTFCEGCGVNWLELLPGTTA